MTRGSAPISVCGNVTPTCIFRIPHDLTKCFVFQAHVMIARLNEGCLVEDLNGGHVEIMPVTLSAAKGLARRAQRSFAALRMTARTLLQSAYGKSSLQTSGSRQGQ